MHSSKKNPAEKGGIFLCTALLALDVVLCLHLVQVVSQE
jgi:hypothetical protein